MGRGTPDLPQGSQELKVKTEAGMTARCRTGALHTGMCREQVWLFPRSHSVGNLNIYPRKTKAEQISP